MAFDFSTLITDRSPEDLRALRDLLATPMADWTAEQLAAFNLAASKGAYNYTDLNRVTACMEYLDETLRAYGYRTGYQRIVVHPKEPPGPVGPLPEGYTQLEYIQSTGTQWINSGISPNENIEVTVILTPLAAGMSENAIFGAQWSINGFFLMFYQSKLRFHSSGVSIDIDNFNQTGENEIICTKTGVTVNETFYPLNGSGTDVNLDIVLFSVSDGAGYPVKNGIYQLKKAVFQQNGQIVRNMIPCKTEQGTIGLYDLANGAFYANAGTGVFTAGPEIPPEPEPEPTLDPYTWYEADVPTVSLLDGYLANVAALRAVLALPETTPPVPADMAGLTLAEANAIEEILLVIEDYLTALASVFRRCDAAICGGPSLYFAN